jgi:hypothetical protein
LIARQSDLKSRKSSTGHCFDTPSQVSSTSQPPAMLRQSWPALLTLSDGHTDEEPVHVSA